MNKNILETGTHAVGYNPEENQCFSGQIAGHELIQHSKYTIAKYQIKAGEQVHSFPSYQVFTPKDLQEGSLAIWWPEKFTLEAEACQVNPQAAIEMIVNALTAKE